MSLPVGATLTGGATRLGHPQVRVARYGFEAVLDEGIVDDVLRLWRRRIPTFASCQGGDPELFGGGRYIACARLLTPRRAEDIAVALGWVDHVVWPQSQTATCFYDANRFPCQLFRIDGVLMMPRASP